MQLKGRELPKNTTEEEEEDGSSVQLMLMSNCGKKER